MGTTNNKLTFQKINIAHGGRGERESNWSVFDDGDGGGGCEWQAQPQHLIQYCPQSSIYSFQAWADHTLTWYYLWRVRMVTCLLMDFRPVLFRLSFPPSTPFNCGPIILNKHKHRTFLGITISQTATDVHIVPK